MVINMNEKEIIEKIKNQNKKLTKEQKNKINRQKFNSIFPSVQTGSYFKQLNYDQEQRGLKLKKSY